MARSWTTRRMCTCRWKRSDPRKGRKQGQKAACKLFACKMQTKCKQKTLATLSRLSIFACTKRHAILRPWDRKKSHVRFFYGRPSQKNFSREIFSREASPEKFLTWDFFTGRWAAFLPHWKDATIGWVENKEHSHLNHCCKRREMKNNLEIL